MTSVEVVDIVSVAVAVAVVVAAAAAAAAAVAAVRTSEPYHHEGLFHWDRAQSQHCSDSEPD